MRVLISGVTGYVGLRLCKALDQAGNEVVGLSRDAQRAEKEVPWLRQAFGWRPMDCPAPAQAFDGVEAVVHLAGQKIGAGRLTVGSLRALMEGRRLVLQHLVDGLAGSAEKPRVLVVASGTAHYGDRGDDLITEETSAGNGLLPELNRTCEAEASRARELGSRVVPLRIGYVVGPGKGAVFLTANLRFYRLGLGGRMGSGRQWWSWIHLEDVVGLLVHVLDRGLDGPVNATSPGAVRQIEFARTLGRVLRRPTFFATPGFMAKLVAGEGAAEVLGSKRVVPRRALDSGYRFRFPDLEPTLRDALSTAQ